MMEESYVDRIEREYVHRHPGVKTYLKSFDYEHLPPHLAIVSRPFALLAEQLVETIDHDSSWLTSALHKLWEAKNEAVMAKLSAS